MKDWWKTAAVFILFLVVIIVIFMYGKRNYSKEYEEASLIQEQVVEAENAPTEILIGNDIIGYKDVVFDGQTYEDAAYVIDGKVYFNSEIVFNKYGFKSTYNVDRDLITVVKNDKTLGDDIRYIIQDDEYYFYSEDIVFADFDEETVSIEQLEEKGITVSVNHRNTRSDNWEPSYITEFVFNYNGISYSATGKPYVYLTVDENYTVTRPEVDVTNLTWRIIEDGQVVLERNAANEYSYRYFGNTFGKKYEVCLLGYYDGYEVISNTVEYIVE